MNIPRHLWIFCRKSLHALSYFTGADYESILCQLKLSHYPGIISNKHRLIYIPVAKVACSSIKRSLFPLFDLDNGVKIHKRPFPGISKKKIVSLKGYFTFAFVRNPWERLVSCYRDKIRHGYINNKYMTNGVYKGFLYRYGNRFYKEMAFADFAAEVCGIPDEIADPHFRSQYYNLEHKGKLIPNYIGRFENLENDFQEICRIKGLSLELPHMNASATKEGVPSLTKVDYRGYYTRELENMVAKRYGRDIDLFDYRFDRQ